MNEIVNHELVIHLTKAGKLPRTIPCACGDTMRRLAYRTGGVYICDECDRETTLDSAELKRRGLK